MRLTLILVSTAFGLAFVPHPVSCQQDDQQDILVAALAYLANRIPVGSAVDARSGAKFPGVPEPYALVARVANRAGFPLADGKLALQCTDQCLPALIELSAPFYRDDRMSEVSVAWLTGKPSMPFKIRGGRDVTLRLSKQPSGQWTVVQLVSDVGYTISPPPPKRDTIR